MTDEAKTDGEQLSASAIIRQLIARNEDLERQLAAAVEHAAEYDGFRAFQSAVSALRESIDTSTAPNHVAMNFNWSQSLLKSMPFHQVEITFVRDGGKTASQMLADSKFNMTRIVEVAQSALANGDDKNPIVQDALEAIIVYAGGDPDARP